MNPSAFSANSVVNASPLQRANQALARLVTGFAGGEKFGAAIASGDVCTRAAAQERRRICNGCPSKVNASIFGLVPSSWCGPPLEDRTHADYGSAKTCGCLLLGKTLVASEACPQGMWGRERRAARGQRQASGSKRVPRRAATQSITDDGATTI